jgi:hypothetical protein
MKKFATAVALATTFVGIACADNKPVWMPLLHRVEDGAQVSIDIAHMKYEREKLFAWLQVYPGRNGSFSHSVMHIVTSCNRPERYLLTSMTVYGLNDVPETHDVQQEMDIQPDTIMGELIDDACNFAKKAVNAPR